MNIELLLTLSTLVNRAVEAIKRLPVFERVPDAWRSEVLLVISNVLSILAVIFLAPGQNLLAGMAGVHPLAGQIFTGIIVAAGSNALHFVVDLINKRAEPVDTNVQISATPADSPSAKKIVEAVQEQQAAA